MKTTLFSTFGAIALASLAFILAPSVASAHDYGRGCHTNYRTCHSLPHGCRSVNYHGRNCWYGGGHYYGCNSAGSYYIIEQPVVEETVYQRPVCERQVEYTQPSYEEDDSISYLPSGCSTVYLGGERCWYSNGCYYRHCSHGYTKFHCGSHERSCSSHVSRSCHSSHYDSCHSHHNRY